MIAWTFVSGLPAQDKAPLQTQPPQPQPPKVQPPAPPRVSLGLEEIVASLEKVLPQTWNVAGIKRQQIPRKWTGSSDAVLLRLEDGSVTVHHPNGFDYHPFYKVWLCPSGWQGNMEDASIQGDEGPSVLLGINHRMKVFYLALGANTWPQGPEVLRKALDLTTLSITYSLRQAVDSSIKMKIFPRLAATEGSSSGLLSRVVGMERDGSLVYIEYATATERRIDGFSLPSMCKEPRVVNLMDRENSFLADQVFFAYPDVRTVYVRRVCDEFLSDRIIDRPGATSTSAAVVSSSTP